MDTGRFLPQHRFWTLCRSLTAVVVVLSGSASMLLAAAPPPPGLRNSDPELVKTLSVAIVAVFGAALPLLTAFFKPGSRPFLTMAIFAGALLANAYALSPLLSTPVQAVLSSIALPVSGVMVLLQIINVNLSPHHRDPRSKF